MNPTLTLVLPGGSESFSIGERLTLGNSPDATVRRSEPWLAPEHVLLVPGEARCWVSVAQGGPVQAILAGAPFASGYLDWGVELELGPWRLRIDRDRPQVAASDNSGEPGADEEDESGISPVLVMALLAAIAFVVFGSAGGTSASADVASAAVVLFDEAGPCRAADPRHRADAAFEAAMAKRERYAFAPQDGIDAVHLFRESAACYARAGDARAAEEAEREAAATSGRVEDELRSRRIRLDRALGAGDVPAALGEAHALAELVRHRPESELAIELRRLQHRLQLQRGEP